MANKKSENLLEQLDKLLVKRGMTDMTGGPENSIEDAANEMKNYFSNAEKGVLYYQKRKDGKHYIRIYVPISKK